MRVSLHFHTTGVCTHTVLVKGSKHVLNVICGLFVIGDAKENPWTRARREFHSGTPPHISCTTPAALPHRFPFLGRSPRSGADPLWKSSRKKNPLSYITCTRLTRGTLVKLPLTWHTSVIEPIFVQIDKGQMDQNGINVHTSWTFLGFTIVANSLWESGWNTGCCGSHNKGLEMDTCQNQLDHN